MDIQDDLAGDMGNFDCHLGSLSAGTTAFVEVHTDACVSAPVFQGYGIGALEYHAEDDPKNENSEDHETTTVLVGSKICE